MPPEAPPAETFSVDSPDLAPAAAAAPLAAAAPVSTHRIGLLLPLRSPTLGPASEALRAGFMAAYERDRDDFVVSVIDTGDATQDVLSSYSRAQEQHDIIVGPLARSAVNAVASSSVVRKPTIALNHPEGRGSAGASTLPPYMLVMGLSIEDEARQVATWAAAEQANGRALILSAGAPWQRRIASAFLAQWQRMGLAAESVEMSALNGYLSDAELVQLRARVRNSPPGLLFAATDADQARQLRVALGSDIPLYGTSSLNPGVGRSEPGQAMDGVRLLDLPWQVQRDHPAVMAYPQLLPSEGRKLSADMQRLYALGIDAYRVAREIALHPGTRINIDGVTGKLTVNFSESQASFERLEQTATYQNGVLAPIVNP